MKPYTHFSLSFVTIVLLWLGACNPPEKTPNHASAIEPPFEKIEIETQDFKIDAGKETILRLPKGGSITVPANAFMDADGNVVKGEVSLKYKQMNSAAEIITSGIPMVCADENGKLQHMQSAGMFDIRGSAAGKDIFIAKDKSLQVNMASTVKGDYDFFYLEEEKPQTATVGFIPQAMAAGVKAAPKTWWRQLTHKVSLAPTKFEALDSFKLKYNTKNFPENKELEHMVWKLSDAKMSPTLSAHQWVLNETWDQISIVKPAYKSRLLSTFSDHLRLLPDSSGFYHVDSKDSVVKLLDAEGKLKKKLCKGSVIHTYLDVKVKQQYLLIKTHSGINVYDVKGSLINEFKGINEAMAISEDRLVYLKPQSSYKGSFYIVISDLRGGYKREISAHMPLDYINTDNYLYYCCKSLLAQKALLVYDFEKIAVYDWNGQLLTETPTNGRSHYYSHYRSSPYRQKVVPFKDKKEQTFVWDWGQNKTYLIPDATWINGIHPEKSELIFTHVGPKEAPNSIYHYNWKTGNPKLLHSYSKQYYFQDVHYSEKGNYIIDMTMKTGALYNKNFEKIYEAPFSRFQFDDQDNVCLLADKERTCLVNSKGQVIKDFTEFDSTGKNIFIKNDKIICFDASGIVMYWDFNGNALPSYNTGIKGFPILENDSLIGVLTSDENCYFYDKVKTNVTHIINLNPVKYVIPLKNNTVYLGSYWEWGKTIISLWKRTEETLQEGEYQLCLSNKDKLFCVYVYLNPEDLKQVEAYQNLQQKAQKKEKERKEGEAEVLRSFEINKFGIYNWDVFYHNEKEYVEMALELEADTLISGHTQFTAFMITGKDQNVVLKFTREQLNNFKFWPSEATQLLVVLPSGKVGIIDTQVFAKLPIEQIKKDRKAKLKLKVYEGVESKKVLDEILKKPSV